MVEFLGFKFAFFLRVCKNKLAVNELDMLLKWIIMLPHVLNTN